MTRVRTCRCLCTYWGHDVCDVEATTALVYDIEGEVVEVPVCGPCADDVASLGEAEDHEEREATA